MMTTGTPLLWSLFVAFVLVMLALILRVDYENRLNASGSATRSRDFPVTSPSMLRSGGRA